MAGTDRSDGIRKLVVGAAVVAGALWLLLGSCGVQPVPPRQVGLLVTGTSAEPVPSLSPAVRALLTSAAGTGDGNAVLFGGDPGRPRQVDSVPLTPRRPDGAIERVQPERGPRIEAAIEHTGRRAAGVHPTRGGLDLLTVLDLAAERSDVQDLVVLSSGLSTTGLLDWRRLRFDLDIPEIVAALARTRSIPDLSGHTVLFSGLGVTAGRQEPLPRPVRETVQAFWLAVCHAGEADSCRIDETWHAAGPPTTRVGTPLVPVPDLPRIVDCTLVEMPDALLGFRGGSTELPAAAADVLRPVVEQLRRGCTVRIVGHTADYGDRAGQKWVSVRRAEAVAAMLRELGAPPGSIAKPEGVGPAEPVRGHDRRSPANRRVTFIFAKPVR